MTTNILSHSYSEITNEERAERLTNAGKYWTESIAKDPSNARLTYKVTGRGYGSVATRIQAGKHAFDIDEPAGLAGDDVAASPVKIALGAFIACQVVVYRLYAQGLGIIINSIDAVAEGDLDVRGLFGIDENMRPGFSEIRLTVQIAGPDSDERYQALRRVVDANCPVLDLFANPTPIKVSVIANG